NGRASSAASLLSIGFVEIARQHDVPATGETLTALLHRRGHLEPAVFEFDPRAVRLGGEPNFDLGRSFPTGYRETEHDRVRRLAADPPADLAFGPIDEALVESSANPIVEKDFTRPLAIDGKAALQRPPAADLPGENCKRPIRRAADAQRFPDRHTPSSA